MSTDKEKDEKTEAPSLVAVPPPPEKLEVIVPPGEFLPSEEDDPIVLIYKPAEGTTGFHGIPRRDLRKSEVEALTGEQRRDVLYPSGTPTYVPVEHKSKKKEG